ncbi:MAG: hypothetical protein ABSF74_04470 [Dehalococcoidia bacterium]|jgi:hypothetical protein
MAKESVSNEVLLDGAQMSLSALLAGTMSFLKKRKIPIKDWVNYIGEQFEGSWEGLEGEKVESVMEHLLTLEVLPMGAEVMSSKTTGGKAEVILTPLPSRKVLKKFGTTPAELLGDFGVTAKEMASIYGMFAPAATAIGLNFSYGLVDGKQVLSLEKAGSKAKKKTK